LGNPLGDIFSVAAEHGLDVKAAGEQTSKFAAFRNPLRFWLSPSEF
jgi:hypothetical protein